ncbi:uncharacterized protein BDZ99DRAFT_570000 [Mytilinidion resinicola]|uniref:Uncharacterized protein n=1 Tax=Mytilinidion resinicola TaxID=574789 RepID=A0A6A6YRX2_9PEZI|nr:uncharacterized protein BDZ99DRAFT_570000 [Mytilinidion resinicola]KAF2810657.1 hypothetical protein BDZ99DRAFT_570000 [Mytilinidion resinicola]
MRGMYDKDYSPTLRVYDTWLDGASLGPELPSGLEVLAPTTGKDSPPSDLQNNSMVPLKDCGDDNIGGSRVQQQDLSHPSAASLQAVREELVDAELEDDQYFVERFLGKRVRRVRRRKIAEYLVKSGKDTRRRKAPGRMRRTYTRI